MFITKGVINNLTCKWFLIELLGLTLISMHIFLYVYIFYEETVFVPIYQLKYTTGNPVGNQFIGNVMM